MKTFKLNLLRCLFFTVLLFTAGSSFAQLHADFTSSPNAGCPPLVVSFADNSTGNPTSWKWDLGNNTISYLQNPIATYFNPGTYNVKLIITSASGVDSVVKSQFITVYSLPEPKFSASDTAGCFPLKVNFTDSSIAGSGTIASWQWDFGDGNLSNLQSPQHTYTSTGNYTVILKVVNSNGCSKVITKPTLIKTVNGVNAIFSYSSVQGCSTPTPVTFTNASTGTGVLTYLWNFGDNGSSATTSPVHNYMAGGSYTVSLIVKNSYGCADTLIKPNAINIGFVKAIMTMPDTLCVDQMFRAINNSNPSTFLGTTWNFGEGTIGHAPSYPMSYSVAGTYVVKMITDFGSCSDSVTKSVVVLPKPVASFTALNTTACSGPLTVTFNNTSTGGVRYVWDFGDSTATSTATSPVHTYTQMGSYSVTLHIINPNGCSDSIFKENIVVISPPRIAKIDSLPLRGCVPFTIYPKVVMVDSITPTGYKWIFGDGGTSTLANPTHTYTTAGSFDVTVIVTTGPGCSDTLKVVDGVRAGNRPTVNFSGTPRDACASTSIQFTDLSSISGGVINDWYWLFGDGGSSTDQSPSYTYNDTGHFNVTLIASNFGCSDTLKIDNYMHILPPIAVFDTAFFCNDPMKRSFIDKSIGAQTWFWKFGDNTTSTQQNPTHVYADTGTYSVSLKVTNGACDFTKTMPVPVVREQGLVTVTDSINCVNARVTFRVANTNYRNIQQYIWLPEGVGQDSMVGTLNALAQYYLTPGPRMVGVVITDILNCRDTIFTPFTVKIYGPKANFASSLKNICYGTVINFFDSSTNDGVHPIVEWKWNFGDSIIKSNPVSGPTSHLYSTQGLYNVMLTIKDSYGCVDSITKPGLVSVSKPVANFIPSDTLLCPSSTVTFNNQSQATGAVYKWNFGDAVTSTTVNPVHTYATPGDYRVSLSVSDKNGCSDSMAVMLHVYDSHAAFTLSDSQSTCPPLIVNITNQSSHYTQFHWDFGDGGNSQLVDPSHIYTYPGTYTVKLIVENNGNCPDSMIKSVMIQGPTGTFSYIPTTICNPGQINYSLVSNNTARYIWDYDDGTTVYTTTSTSSHTYTTPGIYLPKIILENVAGCRVPVVGLDSVKVIGIETNILSDLRTLCDGGVIHFRDSTITNDLPVGIMWNFGDGDTSTQINPVHAYTHTGLYTVSLVAKSDFGCRDTTQQPQYIKVVASPKIKLLGDSVACEPANITFSSQLAIADTSALTWFWNFGNGQTSTLASPPIQTYTTAGSYGVFVKAVNSSGCYDSISRAALIHPKPVVYAGPDTSLCRFAPYTLTASGASTYVWDTSSTLSCTHCPSPVAKPDANITYVVTGTSVNGCLNKDSVKVSVKQPFRMLAGRGDTICIGKSVPLSASGADTYQWSPSLWLDNSVSATPTSRPDSSITYMVVGTDVAKCFKDTATVQIKVYKIPTVNITSGDELTVIVGSSLQINAAGSADVTSYNWSPGQGLSCTTCPNPVSKPAENVTYTVNVKNRGNCEAKDEVTIKLLCNDGNVFIPNTFSPNGDGANDVFYPRGRGINMIRNFAIFNRWGQVVFQKTNISANEPNFGWDGKLEGKPQPTDVYVYIMDVICANNNIFPIKGNVSLVR